MKKFFKTLFGVASIAAVAAGAYYFTKKWMEEKDEELEDDFDDLDFDDEDEFREYVTLDMEGEMEDISEVAEEDIAPDYEEVTTMPAEDAEVSEAGAEEE